ncbi:hypothetical protein P4278_30845 [Bacillus thuringiensis]|nr:hypothetical protein [Bacillus thuringiensis]MED2777772.1 hypothetical protein [Bacillus thuringiensis]MED2784007.1 hypothetical protein [Bacillus thuringiensis]
MLLVDILSDNLHHANVHVKTARDIQISLIKKVDAMNEKEIRDLFWRLATQLRCAEVCLEAITGTEYKGDEQ